MPTLNIDFMEFPVQSELNLQLATLDDLDTIMDLFYQTKLNMRKNGLDQWPDTYPSRAGFEEAIDKNEVWKAVVDERMAGLFTLNEVQDIDYQEVVWKYQGQRVAVLHRVAVHPDFQGRGFGKKLVEASLGLASFLGCDCFRLDTYSLNETSVKLYRSMQFEQADGYCYFHGHKAPFYCFEKSLLQ